MLHCVIWLVILAIIALICFYVLEQFIQVPPNIAMLIKLVVGLLLLLWLLACLGVVPALGRL